MTLRAVALTVVASLLLASCGAEPDAETVAVTFLELYVFNADQAKALQIAEGLAAEKLTSEMNAVQQARREGFTELASRPPISRVLISEDRSDDNTAVFTYRIEVRPKGGSPAAQKMLIHLSRRPVGWRVVNYEFWATDAPTSG